MDPSLTPDWMSLLRDRLLDRFGRRVLFIGLQRSRAREEATDSSDIDAVVILDSVSISDLDAYRLILGGMPETELACGFISGIGEVSRWDPADLFQFRMDTVPILGDLGSLLPPMDPADAGRAAHTGACAIYHACVHNYVHERSADVLTSLYKQAGFVLRAKMYSETGAFLRTSSDLVGNTEGMDRRIASGPCGDLRVDSEILMSWSSGIIGAFRTRCERSPLACERFQTFGDLVDPHDLRGSVATVDGLNRFFTRDG